MKSHLMFPDRDFDAERTPPSHAGDLIQDLELNSLWNAMAGGDKQLFGYARTAMLHWLVDPHVIVYRQQALRDCLDNEPVVRELYALAEGAIAAEREIYRGIFSDRPQSMLDRSVRVLERLLEFLRRLRKLAEEHAAEFRSPGFTALFAAIVAELDDTYLETVESHLKALHFTRGLVMSARLGDSNKGTGYVLREPRRENRRLFSPVALKKPTFSYTVPERDEAGYRALGDLRDRGLNDVANATAQSADHVRDFFIALRNELGFYIGCLNLAGRLRRIGVPLCFPEPRAVDDLALSARELCEPCLSLRLDAPVVGTDIDADGDRLLVITGANQGGKSTFLRSVGVAQLMLQSGMFVAAREFSGSVATTLFTHYRREEDETMESGKLDEELRRMSEIADRIQSGGLLLCNESLSATNEHEGSDIAREVIRAMIDSRVRLAYVTHLYDLAHGLYEDQPADALFLRAERQHGGTRTFRLNVGEPLPTSYGEDLYAKIFGPVTPERARAPGPTVGSDSASSLDRTDVG